MDETYIKIKGKWHYLYRAIDADGLTLDIWLRKKRDTQAAYAFLKRLKAWRPFEEYTRKAEKKALFLAFQSAEK